MSKSHAEWELSDNEEDELSATGLDAFGEAVVAGSDWTAETLIGQLKKGTIDLDPVFQRREVWTNTRKSRFVESLFLGLPVPQIILAASKTHPGRFIVLDGKQRLLTLRHFGASADSEFSQLRLEGLKYLKDLNGKTLEEIEVAEGLPISIDAFNNQTIRTVVVRNWPSEDFLYLVFLRLNSESLPLSPQELRQALHPGPFVSFANEYTTERIALSELLGRSEPDFRMRDVELLVRALAFQLRLDQYRGNLKDFLDKTCKKLNDAWPKQEVGIRESASHVLEAAGNVEKTFEENAFRWWDGTSYEPRFNRAIFDVMIYYFTQEPLVSIEDANRPKVVAAFKRLCEKDAKFEKSVRQTTKSLDAVSYRLRSWGTALQKVVREPLVIPRLVDKRIVVEG